MTDLRVARRYGFEWWPCPSCRAQLVVLNIANRCLNCGWHEQAIGTEQV